MQISRAEIDERLRRADELRRTLRRATRELMEAGARALREREAAKARHDGNRSR